MSADADHLHRTTVDIEGGVEDELVVGRDLQAVAKQGKTVISFDDQFLTITKRAITNDKSITALCQVAAMIWRQAIGHKGQGPYISPGGGCVPLQAQVEGTVDLRESPGLAVSIVPAGTQESAPTI